MTFVSYAQNFEDVMLWRALADVGPGTYIDVGAAHPDIDSVTRAFYDRGWRGINIEPTKGFSQRLAHARPLDINLQLALGETAGELPFFVVPGTGLSTLDPAVAELCAAQGRPVEQQMVQVDTMANVCRNHVRGDVHFLKIDVEGAEHAVLAGADFDTFRPWIVLVEATRPLSTELSHAAWEPLLLRAGYRFVWFDGLNRFYLAVEHHAALAPHFMTPPNVFDNFLRAADTEWARRIHEAESALAESRDRAQVAEAWAGKMADLAVTIAATPLRMQSALLAALRAQNNTRMMRLDAEGESQKTRADQAEAWLAAMHASTSWRLTRPLRSVASLVHRGLGRGPVPPQVEPIVAMPEPTQPAIAPFPAAASDVSPDPITALRAPRSLRTIGTVHQFHSGSAVGDAITNAMLLTRGLLRQMGYRSEIFVEHRDPLLVNELRLLNEMPLHGEQVLIVRHSMGYDGFDRVMALPQRKILFYHNITPPELLAGNPIMQAYARLGRRQLALWQPHVTCALADSDYNAIELRRLGFDPVQTCTLLFDTAALKANAVRRPARPAACFTIMFVGRVTASKGQLELITAYARFRETCRQPSRLVIVGRLETGTGYVEALSALIAEESLSEHVLITGFVSDEELNSWYAAADLYVSLSLHEGFGVPLIEAVARGVPVLAWASGAIPYTLGVAEGLLHDRDAEGVAARMLSLATDPAANAGLRLAQHRSMERFQLDRQQPALSHALALAGAAPPRHGADPIALERHMRMTVTGHVQGSYSLAAVNRTLAAALATARPHQVRLLPVAGEAPAPSVLAPSVPVFVTGPHVVVSNHYPVLVPEDVGDLALALFYWEESLVPPETIKTLDDHFDGVLAPTRAVAKALLDSGLTRPVRVLGQALDLAPFQKVAAARLVTRPRGTPVTFLHISSCFARKGVDVLLAAYARAFRAGDAVRLIIKGFPNPHNDIAAQVAALRGRDAAVADITLIDCDLGPGELLALYAAADAMVLPSRGEGFNMVAAEAMAAGLPLIVTGAGGHMDFCGHDTARLLAWRFAYSATHLAVPHSLWIEPDEGDLVAALREMVASCLQDDAAMMARTQRAASAIATATAGAVVAARLRHIASDLLLTPPHGRLRLAIVTSWDVRCGVAEYARHLVENIAATDRIDSLCILADERTAPVAQPGGPRVRHTWRLGDAESMSALAVAIAQEDPHVVSVQHQPGLFSFAALARLLGEPALAGRVVCVTLHSVEPLLAELAAVQAHVIAALATVSRVIVHSLADLEHLRQSGLVANTTLIPQGAPVASCPPKLRTMLADAPRVGCYGFFLPGKGIAELIQALALLRRQRPHATLHLVNADYGAPESMAEIARCRALAEACAVADAIVWHTEFLPNADSLALLADCDVVVLPTQASREGSSASVRGALAAGVPVLVTPLLFFDEAQDAVARTQGFSAESLADSLERLLSDAAERARLQERAQIWLSDRAWSGIASRTVQMWIGLAVQESSPRPV